LDLDLRYQAWNPYMEKLTGTPAAEVLGRSCLEVFPFLAGTGLPERAERAFSGATVAEVEFSCTSPAGAECWLTETMAVLPNAAGETIGLVLTVRDITEKRRVDLAFSQMQTQLHQAQKMESLGNLTGGIAHDFNNMLCGIMGATEMLQLSAGEWSEQQRNAYLELILTTTQRAADLTSKLLAFSRKGYRKASAVDVARIIEETVVILRRTIDKRISIRMDNQAAVPTVAGDAAMLQGVFMNMGINASHAMPDGGDLVFAIRNVSLDPDFCAGCGHPIAPGDYLRIEIRDTGTGMAPEVLGRIFEPFFTTKAAGKGTGLGLSVAYGTILDHGGTISVLSQAGAGTAFHIHLPVSPAAETGRVPEAEPSRGRGTILLVDDEEVLLVTTRAILEATGYRVLTARNGWEAVETFRERHREIDGVILDLIMPIMGGRRAFDLIQAVDPRVPIILISGFLKDEELAEMEERGLRGCIRKPFHRQELSRVLAEALAST